MNPITTTAQALAFLSGTDWLGLVHVLPLLLLSMGLVFLFGWANQAAIEALIAFFLPGWAFFVKPLLPAVSTVILTKIHALAFIPGVDTVTGTAALVGATHLLNEMPLALNLEGKWPKAWAWILKYLPKAAPALLVALGGLALLGMARPAQADYVSPTAGTSPGVWQGLQIQTGLGMTDNAFSGNGVFSQVDGGLLVEAVMLNFQEAIPATPQPLCETLAFAAGASTVAGVQHVVVGLGAGFGLGGVPWILLPNWNLGSGQAYPNLGLIGHF